MPSPSGASQPSPLFSNDREAHPRGKELKTDSGRFWTAAALAAAFSALASGLPADALGQARFHEFPEYASPFEKHAPPPSGRRLAQSVPTEGTRLALMAGYHYWPQAGFENSAVGAGYMLERRTVGGPMAAAAFGYRATSDWDVSLEVGYTWESIRFERGATNHSTIPLLFVARWLPWPGRVEPYFGLGGGYVLNFYTGGVMDYVESHSMGLMADAGVFVTLSPQVAFLAELRFTYAVSEMSEPFESRMGGGLALTVGIQWGFRAQHMELH